MYGQGRIAAEDARTMLYLRDELLGELPPEIGQLTNLTRLDLDGNPLTSPPLEIVRRGVGAVQRYLVVLEGESRILNEAVGEKS